MVESKDFWDKVEIFGKTIIPIMVAATVWHWNGQQTKKQTTAAMTQIAIGVLKEKPSHENPDDPLRDWAINVLQNPSDPPNLTDNAAEQLRIRGLTAVLF